jgi:dihydrofolate reductase
VPSVRSLVYYITISLDGYFSGPNGELEHFEPSESEHQYANDLLRDADAALQGRLMHEVMSYWDGFDPTDASAPRVAREFASIYQTKPRYVFSRKLTSADDRTTIYKDDIIDRVAALKDQPGSYLLLGCGPELLALFLEYNLVDEIRLLVAPLLLGEGVRLFGAATEVRALKLASSQTFETGSVLLTYKTA